MSFSGPPPLPDDDGPPPLPPMGDELPPPLPSSGSVGPPPLPMDGVVGPPPLPMDGPPPLPMDGVVGPPPLPSDSLPPPPPEPDDELPPEMPDLPPDLPPPPPMEMPPAPAVETLEEFRGRSAALPEGFAALLKRTASLQNEEYWATDAIDDPMIEGRLRAAAFVFQGDELFKYRKNGRDKPHRRFVKVMHGQKGAELLWDKSKGGAKELVVRADGEIYESCFQGAKIDNPDAMFQVGAATR